MAQEAPALGQTGHAESMLGARDAEAPILSEHGRREGGRPEKDEKLL